MSAPAVQDEQQLKHAIAGLSITIFKDEAEKNV